MKEAALQLENLAKSNLIEMLDIQKSVSDLDDALSDPFNPLAQKIPLESRNIFVDIY